MENLKEFDTCKLGSSVVLAALGRSLQAEVASLLQQKVCEFFYDYHICFDSMDIGILLAEAIHTSYPPVHMAFAIQQHVAPRIIKLKNSVGSPIGIYNSIIAGCRQSIPMARVYLQRGIDNVTNNSIPTTQ